VNDAMKDQNFCISGLDIILLYENPIYTSIIQADEKIRL